MASGKTQSTKSSSTSPWSDNLFESMKGISGGIGSGVVNDFGKGVAKGVGQGLGSFFGGFGGEAMDRQERPWNTDRRERPLDAWGEQPRKRVRQEFSIFNNGERQKQLEVEHQINAIREELKFIIKQMGEMDSQAAEAEKAVAMEIITPGKYHVSMFERIRQILKLLRKQLSESKTWLEMTFAKKKARNYWSMYKKKGTTFGLSNERNVATQAG